jgi:cation-transporting ATPase E
MFTIGIPGFLLSQLPNKDIIRGNFVENILKHAIPAGLSDAFMIATMVVCGTILGLQTTDISTATTLVIAVVGFVYIYTIIRPLDNLRALILFGCILGLVLCTAFLPTLFSMARMEWRGWVLAVVMSLICPFVLRAINFVVSKLWEFIRSIHLNKTEKIRG